MDDYEAPTFFPELDFESKHGSFALGFDQDEGEYEKPAISNQ